MPTSLPGHIAKPHPQLALSHGERWFVVHTQPHREAQASRHLENQAYRVFAPLFLKSRRHARKIETISAPLFPRYLFIILNLAQDHWRSVNGTYGVHRLLMRGDEPEPVPEGLVEQLMDLAEPNGVIRSNPNLKAGQLVSVTAGPFAELLGTLQSLDDSKRVRVLLELLGRQVAVTLPQSVVMPANGLS